MLAASLVRALRPAGDNPDVRAAITAYAQMIRRLKPDNEYEAAEIYQQSVLASGRTRLLIR